jgi:hypothetical protein
VNTISFTIISFRSASSMTIYKIDAVLISTLFYIYSCFLKCRFNWFLKSNTILYWPQYMIRITNLTISSNFTMYFVSLLISNLFFNFIVKCFRYQNHRWTSISNNSSASINIKRSYCILRIFLVFFFGTYCSKSFHSTNDIWINIEI